MKQALNSWFDDTASALVWSLAETQADPAHPALRAPYNDLTRFVLGQHARMADYLRLPLAALALGFDLSGCAHGRPFHAQMPADRLRQIAAWRDSGAAFRRDLIKYFESLATLALHSRDDGILRVADGSQSPPPASEQVLFDPPPELSAEIVVVGSGPGGAITACLLAEAGRDVLLIEEGDYLSLDSCRPFTVEEMVQKYRNGGQTVALGANKISYVEGRCVGGGSEINSGLYHRTPPEILEQWQRDFQVEAIAERDLRPHFEACEADLSVSPTPGALPPPSAKLREGAARLGWKSLEVPRWYRYGKDATDAAGGQRQSMTETYVPRFLRAGGRLLPRTRVASFMAHGSKWSLHGRHAALGAVRITTENLFIAGGAVQTPALLRRCGFNQHVGNSLRLHPTIKVVAKFPDSVNLPAMGVPSHQVKQFAPRFSFGCSISSPAYLALALLEHPSQARRVASDWPRMATYYAMITGESRGTVRSLPGFQDPLVRYHLTQSDQRDLADGLRKLCEVLFAGGAAALYPGVLDSAELTAPGDLAKLPQTLPYGLASLMTIHLFSSCPMGEDRSKCATDSFGRVHGFRNLFVADASLLCTAPGVNPQGSIMAVARRNALHFLHER
jgi:choline dehydrogenase-like flavoprotein